MRRSLRVYANILIVLVDKLSKLIMIDYKDCGIRYAKTNLDLFF
jgi:hypothetical protein